LEAALAAWRAEGLWRSTAHVLRSLGEAALGQGDRDAARAHLVEFLALTRRGEMSGMVAAALEGFSGLAAAAGCPERAARLAGAGAAVRAATGAPMGPAAAALLERELASARQALQPERFAATWAAGQAMPLEEAVAYALQDATADARADSPPAPPAGRAGHTRSSGGLSAREAEVLGLLAGGRTNQEIAAGLGLSPKTVERHLANIYAKIGVRNRAGAATYALRHGLAPSAAPA
jgi:DNA-binding CsgD family transcriptional regulator